MDSVRPWVDSDEVRRLAERLLGAREDVVIPDAEAPFGNRFEGYTEDDDGATVAAEPAQEKAPEPVGEASEAVQVPEPDERLPGEQLPGPEETALDEGAPLPDDGMVEAPRGPFLQRVQRLRQWLREQFQVRGMFLLDREGSVIFDDGVHEELQALARSLAQASRVSAGVASNVHVKVGSDATLEVIPAETHYGVIVLGAVVPQAITPRGVGLVIDALARTARPPGATAGS